MPVAIKYPGALALRQMAAKHDEYPHYLLAPKVSVLLHYVPDLNRKMLLTTLWNPGTRINEALALTRGISAWPYSYVQLATLKQRSEKVAPRPGRAPSGVVPHRLVPLSDPQYVAQLEMMVATRNIPLERRNPETGQTEKVWLWTVNGAHLAERSCHRSRR